jgi:predicted dehydrogenase
MDSIRWGLLSTAKINQRLIGAIRQSNRGTVEAVASRDLKKAQAYASEWEIPRAFGSYEAMLAADEVDAVYVSLPNHLHGEWTIAALQMGKHVLCEKPFALTLDEVDRMVSAAADYDRVLAEAFMYLHHPQTQRLAALLQEGRLGRISLIRATLEFSVPNRADNIRLVPAYGGGGLWDAGSYPVSFAQFAMGGPPQDVQAIQQLGDTGVDEFFAGQMAFSGGAVAQFSTSLQTPYHQMAEITGTEGRLTLSHPFTSDAAEAEMIFFPRLGEPEKLLVPTQDAYLGQVQDMHAAILDGRPNRLSLEGTRDRIETILRLYQAASDP